MSTAPPHTHGGGSVPSTSTGFVPGPPDPQVASSGLPPFGSGLSQRIGFAMTGQRSSRANFDTGFCWMPRFI